MTDQLIGQTLAGKYRLEELWREDAISRTYHAAQVLIDKLVTVKILNSALANDNEVIASFQQEARILSRINNPHVLNVLDFGSDDARGVPFLVLENAEGRTLRDFIRDEGGSPLERAVAIINQIADALTAAHTNGIVHGNLSSDKILIGERNGREFVKVLDFGAAIELDVDEEKTVVRADLPFYRAPEQLADPNAASASSDVYALGVLLYEILTAKPPFTADNPAVLAQKHVQEIPPSLIAVRPDLPPILEQVVQRALAKQPNQRFLTIGEFAEALNRAAKSAYADSANAAYAAGNFDPTGAARPTPTVESNVNNPYKTAFIVLAGICLLSIAAIYFTGGFRDTPTSQLNADPNSQAVQPLNPTSSNVEDLSNLGLQTVNSNLNDPLAVPSGGVTGVPQGIPPGLYPGAGGQTVTIPGDSNSIFMQDLNANVSIQTNVNAARVVNANAAGATNSNVRAAGANVNATASPQRLGNANSSGGTANANAAPAPTAAPTAAPRPRNSPTAPANNAPPKSNSNETGGESTSDLLK